MRLCLAAGDWLRLSPLRSGSGMRRDDAKLPRCVCESAKKWVVSCPTTPSFSSHRRNSIFRGAVPARHPSHAFNLTQKFVNLRDSLVKILFVMVNAPCETFPAAARICWPWVQKRLLSRVVIGRCGRILDFQNPKNTTKNLSQYSLRVGKNGGFLRTAPQVYVKVHAERQRRKSGVFTSRSRIMG